MRKIPQQLLQYRFVFFKRVHSDQYPFPTDSVNIGTFCKLPYLTCYLFQKTICPWNPVNGIQLFQLPEINNCHMNIPFASALFFCPLLKTLHIQKSCQIIGIHIRVLKGKQQNHQTKCYSKSGQQNFLIKSLQQHTADHNKKNFPDYTKFSFSQFLIIPDAFPTDHQTIPDSLHIHHKIQRPPDICSVRCDRK